MVATDFTEVTAAETIWPLPLLLYVSLEADWQRRLTQVTQLTEPTEVSVVTAKMFSGTHSRKTSLMIATCEENRQ